MDWNGSLIRPFVTRPESSLSFLYNCNYDHFPGKVLGFSHRLFSQLSSCIPLTFPCFEGWSTRCTLSLFLTYFFIDYVRSSFLITSTTNTSVGTIFFCFNYFQILSCSINVHLLISSSSNNSKPLVYASLEKSQVLMGTWGQWSGLKYHWNLLTVWKGK